MTKEDKIITKEEALRSPSPDLTKVFGGAKGFNLGVRSTPGNRIKSGGVGTGEVGDLSVGTGAIIAGAVTLPKLASIISPTRIVKLSGTVTWSGGGATLTSTVSGVLSTDLIMATISTKPAQAAYLVRATPGTDQIVFELSAANTSNDAVIAYTVFRSTS